MKECFNMHFSHARNVEWNCVDDLWEAIFFDEDIEKTAKIDRTGRLVEYRINITPDDIPPIISSGVDEHYEIMNCIAVYTSETTKYELIVRDKEFSRFLLMVDSLGYKIRMERL